MCACGRYKIDSTFTCKLYSFIIRKKTFGNCMWCKTGSRKSLCNSIVPWKNVAIFPNPTVKSLKFLCAVYWHKRFQENSLLFRNTNVVHILNLFIHEAKSHCSTLHLNVSPRLVWRQDRTWRFEISALEISNFTENWFFCHIV